MKHGYRYLLIHGHELSQVYVHGECKGETDQVPSMYLIDCETELRLWLCPMQTVMEIIRNTVREVTREGNLSVSVCISGSPTIFPSVFEF